MVIDLVGKVLFEVGEEQGFFYVDIDLVEVLVIWGLIFVFNDWCLDLYEQKGSKNMEFLELELLQGLFK